MWYLANDMQFFILTPLFLYAYCNFRAIGYFLIGLFMVASTLTIGLLTRQFDIGPDPLNDITQQYNDKLYFRPWARITPYLIGLLLGLMYFEFKQQEKYPEFKGRASVKIFYLLSRFQWLRLATFFLGFALTFVTVFTIHDVYAHDPFNTLGKGYHWSLSARLFWNMFSRGLFILGLALVLMPTFTGKLRGLSMFLGSNFWSPLSRLTFSLYLIHPLTFTWYYGTTR